MANLTIRKLDEAIKVQLRLRAAANGRSVEDEVRTILRDAAAPSQALAPAVSAEPSPAKIARRGVKGVTLIIGGGIAAFKSLELIRRLKERSIDVRCVLT